MLVLAAAGLDAICKQVIIDAFQVLAIEGKSREQLAKFAERQLDAELPRRGSKVPIGNKLLASLFAAPNPRVQLVKHFVADMTGGSLQSEAELARVAGAVGLELTDLRDEDSKGDLRDAFDARNEISHEFDIDFNAPTRNRRRRTLKSLVRQANALLSVAERLVIAVDKKVMEKQKADAAAKAARSAQFQMIALRTARKLDSTRGPILVRPR
jgi:hypothetical protein